MHDVGGQLVLIHKNFPGEAPVYLLTNHVCWNELIYVKPVRNEKKEHYKNLIIVSCVS